MSSSSPSATPENKEESLDDTDGNHTAVVVVDDVSSNANENTKKDNDDDDDDDDAKHHADDLTRWPEEPNNAVPWHKLVYTRWTFSYMNRILVKGSRQMRPDGTHLALEDLYRVPPSMTSDVLVSQFFEYYEQAKNKENRVVHTLWRLAAPTFIPAGVCQLVAVLCQVAVPLMVRELLDVLQNHPGQNVVRQGLVFVIAIAVLLALNAVFTHRHRHLATKSGIIMRAAVVNVVYNHALRLTPNGKQGLTSGEVTNLVAIDTQKLFEVTQEGHLIWSMPLSMILVTILLVIIMGPTTLVGVVALIAFIPIVERLASIMLRIRQARVKLTDQRVNIVNAMLQGIKVTKLNNYEESYQKRIEDVRNREIRYLKWELAVWGFTLVVTVITPVIAAAATFATFVLVSDQNRLTSAATFSVLLLFAALRFPINYAGRLIGRAAQAVGSIRRLTAFLSRETRSNPLLLHEDDHHHEPQKQQQQQLLATQSSSLDEEPSMPQQQAQLSVENGTFRIGVPKLERQSAAVPHENMASDEGTVRTGFELSGVNFMLKPGQILAVCGPVGSGKSTLTLGLIDEIQSLPGTVVTMMGRAAYVSQTPFILNATLRENILFGLPFNRDCYERVLDACCLRADIEQLGDAGDRTEIGERGVTLSGGQKQRVSLARAAYAQPDVVLCDDPLSALDAGTAKKVFERLFRSTSTPAIFANTAVVLVTHASHFLNRVDQILVIVDGVAKFQGSWPELISFKPSDAATVAAVEFIQSCVQEAHIDEKDLDDNTGTGAKEDESESVTKSNGAKRKGGALITEETREHGLSTLKTWLLWFKHAGGIPFFVLQVLLMTIDRLAYVGVEYWLAQWTQGATKSITFFGTHFQPQSDGIAAQYRYLKVYAIILAISVLSTIARSEWVVTGGARCAKTIFSAMLVSTLKAPVSYFESTPMGRILNRYTYDMEIADVSLTEAMSTFMIAMSWFVASIVILCTIIPWILLGLVPIITFYGFLLLHYRRSGPDLQRIDAVSRSPIQAMLTEGLDGASTIRVYQQEKTFLQRFQSNVDSSSSALLNFVSAQRWLGVRIEFLGSIVVLLSCLLVISLNNTLQLPAGVVGLLIIWSVNFTITLGFLVDNFSDSESAITSIERVDAMSRLPEEKSMVTSELVDLPSAWPEAGRLEFNNVCLRYRESLPLALNGLTFSIPAGKRCAVVGRTGAGKSSLTVALFRLVEIESGSIMLDGLDLALLGLRDVRGRGMSIIPQDPFLAGTTIRECIDPFGRSLDQEILEALKSVRLASPDEGVEVLEQEVDEGGSNFSVGERQLINLARALLAKPRLLVLDEATASVDGETDAFIQRMLRTRFQETSLLTVAHRLNTIMDYDLVLVMDAGRAVEFGPPEELLSRSHGLFTELVNATGVESASALNAMVFRKMR